MIEFSITIGRVVVVSILYLSVGTIECVIFFTSFAFMISVLIWWGENIFQEISCVVLNYEVVYDGLILKCA